MRRRVGRDWLPNEPRRVGHGSTMEVIGHGFMLLMKGENHSNRPKDPDYLTNSDDTDQQGSLAEDQLQGVE